MKEKSFFKKIFDINIWNFLYSFFSFLSNLLIGKILGVEIFAEFSILSVYISFVSLVFILIPPNVAIFKCQDEENFREIYFVFYSYFSVITVLLNYFSWLYLKKNIEIDFFIFALYSFGFVWFNYIDVTIQSQGKLKKYFIILTMTSIIKVIILVVLYYIGIVNNVNDLLFSFGVAQFFILIYIWINDPVAKFISLVKWRVMFTHLRLNYKAYKGYYLNTGLKRFQDQIGVLMFSFVSNKEILGVYSLLIKSLTFLVSLIRSVEAYFVNRKNIESHFEKILSKSILLGVFFQLIFIPFSILYLYIMIEKLYWISVIIGSFYFLFYLKSTLIRVKSYSTYEIRSINFNQIVYIICMVFFSLIIYVFDLINLEVLVFTYVLTNLIYQVNMIFLFKKNY